MQAGLDISLNNNFSEGDIYGKPASIFAPVVNFVCRLALEWRFAPYSEFHPLRNPASVYSAPVLIPTAAVGANPWDNTFGPIGIYGAGAINVPALNLTPQVGSSSFA